MNELCLESIDRKGYFLWLMYTQYFCFEEFQPTCYRIPKHIIFNGFMLKSNNRTVKNGEQDTKNVAFHL